MAFREKLLDGTTLVRGITLNDIFNAVYPVGTIFASVQNVNPGTLFGGTWVAWGAGRVPVGVDTSDANFNTVEKTGGANTHTHPLDDNAWAQIAMGGTGATSASRRINIGTAFTENFRWNASGSAGTVASSSVGTALDGNTAAGSSLQKYITCYMFKRTA